MTPRPGRKSKPPGRKNPENMAVSEKGDMAFQRADSCDHTVDPSANLIRTLPAGAAVAEDHPTGRFCVDLFRGEAFIFSIIPFHQVTIDFSAMACVPAQLPA